MTMMVIRIATMTTVYGEAYKQIRKGLGWARESPRTHTHTCMHTYLAGFRNITDLYSIIIPANAFQKTCEGKGR